MKKLAIAGAVLAALSLSGCATQEIQSVEEIPEGIGSNEECVVITTKSYYGGTLDQGVDKEVRKVFCVATVKLDREEE